MITQTLILIVYLRSSALRGGTRAKAGARLSLRPRGAPVPLQAFISSVAFLPSSSDRTCRTRHTK